MIIPYSFLDCLFNILTIGINGLYSFEEVVVSPSQLSQSPSSSNPIDIIASVDLSGTTCSVGKLAGFFVHV